MKVGDYVRTNKGIRKVTIEDVYDINLDTFKSSSNIIDLIEIGDYVNGREVRKVYDLGFGKCFCFKNDYGKHYDKNYKIKSIVTKEQFESIKYEVNK